MGNASTCRVRALILWCRSGEAIVIQNGNEGLQHLAVLWQLTTIRCPFGLLFYVKFFNVEVLSDGLNCTWINSVRVGKFGDGPSDPQTWSSFLLWCPWLLLYVKFFNIEALTDVLYRIWTNLIRVRKLDDGMSDQQTWSSLLLWCPWLILLGYTSSVRELSDQYIRSSLLLWFPWLLFCCWVLQHGSLVRRASAYTDQYNVTSAVMESALCRSNPACDSGVLLIGSISTIKVFQCGGLVQCTPLYSNAVLKVAQAQCRKALSAHLILRALISD